MTRRDRKKIPISVFKPKYSVNKSTNQLEPPTIPKSGDLVTVHGRNAPDDQKEIFADNDWVLYGEMYLMSLVTFWSVGVTYTFQIRPTEIVNVGQFVLIQTAKMDRMPERKQSPNKSSGTRKG